MACPRGVARQDEGAWSGAVDLHRSVGREAIHLAARRRRVEVRFGDDGVAGAELRLEPEEHDGERGSSERLRPVAIACPQRLEQQLLDRVLRDERQRQLARERLCDRRLAARRWPGDDDEKRHVPIGHLARAAGRRDDRHVGAWSDEDVAVTITGLFQISGKLGDILAELVAIGALLEEDDGRGDAEEDRGSRAGDS
jgi:hypothetical protein